MKVPVDTSVWSLDLRRSKQNIAAQAQALRQLIQDHRVQGLLSEALSSGLAGYALWNHDEVVHIADAGPFIGRAITDQNTGISNASLRSLGICGKNGG